MEEPFVSTKLPPTIVAVEDALEDPDSVVAEAITKVVEEVATAAAEVTVRLSPVN